MARLFVRCLIIFNKEINVDSYETFFAVQECVTVVVQDANVLAGICIFPMDQKIEFFVQEFPICCSKESSGEAHLSQCVFELRFNENGARKRSVCVHSIIQ